MNRIVKRRKRSFFIGGKINPCFLYSLVNHIPGHFPIHCQMSVIVQFKVFISCKKRTTPPLRKKLIHCICYATTIVMQILKRSWRDKAVTEELLTALHLIFVKKGHLEPWQGTSHFFYPANSEPACFQITHSPPAPIRKHWAHIVSYNYFVSCSSGQQWA